jgi:hypothetical protein
MLNGNAWALGNKFASGGEFGGGDAVSLTVTFPNVTVQPGAVVDLSFASKVQGVCYSFYHSGWNAPRLEFYSAGFLDGSAPNISPGPCWIPEGFTNTCQLPWPLMLPSIPSGGSYTDLDSQKVGFDARTARTLLKMIPGTESNCFTVFGTTYCDYETNIWCTPETTPPLYQPSGVHAVNQAVPNPAYYWLTFALCERFPPGPWNCIGVTSKTLGFAGPDNYPKYACTVPPL